MMKVTLITLGKLKEKYLRDAADEYIKRLSRYCNLNVIEIEPKRLSDNPSNAEICNALEAEAELILKKINDDAYVVSLCVEGKEMPSELLAEKINGLSSMGKSIVFIIGSSYGLSENIKRKSDLKLSLSQMTFPHKLFRVMLLEQLYRSFMINQGSQYHK